MKLLIDIPEKIVTAIQNGEDYRYDLHTTIAQGIPYEPNGDLISRKALKQMMPAPIEDEYKRVHQIIDNIPSVEPHYVSDLPDDVVKTLQTLAIDYSDGIATFERKRPTGKWIRKVDEVGFVSHICSECGAEIEVEDPIDDKFCFNCGASMKGDVENG